MERKKAEKTAEQFEKMASMEVWTVQAFSDDLSAGLSSWRSKIPGMSNVKELQTTKRVAQVLKAVSEIVGPNATGEDLSRLSKKEKLKICIKAETSMEEVNGMIQQFEAMQMMHQMLRYRKKVGKPLPKDQAALKMAMAEDSDKAFSKEQLKTMRMKLMKGKQRRR
jgi:signal recognition particle GTPase